MSEPSPDCLFCRIVAGEIPATVVLDTERVLAFRDISPQAPVHVVVIPKDAPRRRRSPRRRRPGARRRAARGGAAVAAQEGLADGFRVVLNTGADGGQTVFHVHAHVLGGRGLGWPPG